jgi:protein-disulfide isomerase
MKLKDLLFLIFIGVLAVCALVFTGLIVQARFFSSASRQQKHINSPLVTRQVPHWRKLKLTGQRAGPADAPVQIIEFFDYQCPFCKAVQPAVKAIRQKYPKKVAVYYENNPLSMHINAFGAAVAAECARHLAPKSFMAYHDALFAHQYLLGRPGLYERLATEVGISDSTGFRLCVENKSPAYRIASGQALANKLNIHCVPTFIINGSLVSGALTERQLNGLVQGALAEAVQ